MSAGNGVESYVPIEDAARFLAVPLSWLYDADSKGKVPSRKIGKYRRFKLSELEAWASGNGNSEHADPLVNSHAASCKHS